MPIEVAGMKRILTSTLEGLDILRALSKLSDGLHESDSRFLVSLERRKNGSGHFSSLSV